MQWYCLWINDVLLERPLQNRKEIQVFHFDLFCLRQISEDFQVNMYRAYKKNIHLLNVLPFYWFYKSIRINKMSHFTKKTLQCQSEYWFLQNANFPFLHKVNDFIILSLKMTGLIQHRSSQLIVSQWVEWRSEFRFVLWARPEPDSKIGLGQNDLGRYWSGFFYPYLSVTLLLFGFHKKLQPDM